MALFGVLSLGQIIFLPGYLLLRALRVGTGILSTCVLSFALSLVINHVLVTGLVVLGVYRPAVVYAVFAAEVVLLLAGDHRWLRMGLAEAAATWRQRARNFCQAVGCVERTSGDEPIALRRTLLAAAVLVIGGFALSGIAQAGQIFQQWDAVVSWNRWAVDWAANRLPYATSLYPQLLPTNLSLTYVFMQSSEVWIFAKAFQFLFCLMLLLAMFDLARIEGKFGYVPGVLITYGLLVALLRFRMLSSGYADVPLAFFAVASVYVLLLARNRTDTRDRTKLLIAGALLAAGAAVTKQTGLYVAAIYPVLAWRFVLRGDEPSGLRKHLPALVRMCLILGILVVPWYLYKYFDFQAGRDSNNTALLLTEVHQGRDLSQRLFHAGNMVVEAITPTGAALLVIAVAASLRYPLQRWLVGLLVAPLALIWAIGFSYDLRNLAVIVPWIGSAAGIGVMQIISWTAVLGRISHRNRVRETRTPSLVSWVITPARKILKYVRPSSLTEHKHIGQAKKPDVLSRRGNTTLDQKPQPGFLRIGHVAGLSALLLIAVCLCVSNEMLLTCQLRQQRTVGIPELNGQLYAYAASHPAPATIATDYQAMGWLPELGERSVVCTCHEFSAFRRTFDRPEVRCVLLRAEDAAAEVRAFLEGQTAAQLVFENHGFAFYEKVRHPALQSWPGR